MLFLVHLGEVLKGFHILTSHTLIQTPRVTEDFVERKTKERNSTIPSFLHL